MKLILLAIVFVVGVYFFARAKSPSDNNEQDNQGGGSAGGGFYDGTDSVDRTEPVLRNEEMK